MRVWNGVPSLTSNKIAGDSCLFNPLKAEPMLLESLQKVKLFELLYQIDKDLAEQQRQKRCLYCGSPLHYANYTRKPRGGPENLPDEMCIRHSLCCSSEGCRRRILPCSLRFWERRVYFGVVMLVVTTLRQGRTEGSGASRLKHLLGVSVKTLKRWRQYFEAVFPFSRRWQTIRGNIAQGLLEGEFPGALVSWLIANRASASLGLVTALWLLSGVPMVSGV